MRWDRFLTERDRQHLAVWGKKRPDALGAKPALLVIDVYYASVGHERKELLESVKDWPMSCGLDGWRAIDEMKLLIGAARERGVPVVYVRALPGFPSDPSRVAERGRRDGNVSALPDAIRAMGNEIVAEIAPQPGELVIGKTGPSAFAGTPLLHFLQMRGIDTIIACGESTSGCVRASVVDAATNRFRVGVVEDCCYDRTEASHWVNLFDMHQKYAEVMNREAASSYFRSVGAERPVPAG
jgi:maleamate amidohydrolase